MKIMLTPLHGTNVCAMSAEIVVTMMDGGPSREN